MPGKVVQNWQNGSRPVSGRKIDDVVGFKLVNSLKSEYSACSFLIQVLSFQLCNFNKIIESAMDSQKIKTQNCDEDSREVFCFHHGTSRKLLLRHCPLQ